MANPLASLRQQKLRIEKVENTAVPPNTERTLFDRNGPGVVLSVWMALGGGNAPALDARLRVYYDGSSSAAIDIDMGTLLATHWGAGSTGDRVVRPARVAGGRVGAPRVLHGHRHRRDDVVREAGAIHIPQPLRDVPQDRRDHPEGLVAAQDPADVGAVDDEPGRGRVAVGEVGDAGSEVVRVDVDGRCNGHE
jgi:hypothetical protein